MASPILNLDGIKNLRIHRNSLEGVDSFNQIPNLSSVYINHSNGLFKYKVDKVLLDPNDSNAFYLNVSTVSTVVPTGSATSEVVFTPYSIATFKNSDYDALLSNAVDIRNSRTFVKVEYDANQLIPSNLTGINARSLPFVNIQDTNYSSDAYSNIRYNGSYLQAQELNEYNPGDKSFGKVPVVERLSKYFSFAKSAEKLDPLIVGKTQYTSKYLIDENKNIIDLSAIPDAHYFTTYNFEEGSKVNVQLEDPLYSNINNYYLNGTKSIFKAGKRAELLLSTETTLGSFTSSIDFPAEGNVSNYSFLGVSNGNQPLIVTTQLEFVEQYDAPSFYSGNDTYTFLSSDSNAKIQFRLKGVFRNGRTQAHDFTVRIKKGSVVIATKTLEVPAISDLPFELISDYQYFAINDAITVEGNSTAGALGSVLDGAEFDLAQDPAAKIAIASTNIWSTGSAGGNSLTGSATLGSVYGLRIQSPNIGSSFPSASIPFTVEVGDEIRFGGSEANSFIITDVNKAGKIYLTLDRAITGSVNIQRFTHRRYVDDASSIIVNQKKTTEGVTSAVYLTPKYTTEELKTNLNEIIKDLKSRGVI